MSGHQGKSWHELTELANPVFQWDDEPPFIRYTANVQSFSQPCRCMAFGVVYPFFLSGISPRGGVNRNASIHTKRAAGLLVQRLEPPLLVNC